LFGQESACDFDETQIGEVMNNPPAIGIEKHYLYFRPYPWRRLGNVHIGQ
jgi:hypothetical protein